MSTVELIAPAVPVETDRSVPFKVRGGFEEYVSGRGRVHRSRTYKVQVPVYGWDVAVRAFRVGNREWVRLEGGEGFYCPEPSLSAGMCEELFHLHMSEERLLEHVNRLVAHMIVVDGVVYRRESVPVLQVDSDKTVNVFGQRDGITFAWPGEDGVFLPLSAKREALALANLLAGEEVTQVRKGWAPVDVEVIDLTGLETISDLDVQRLGDLCALFDAASEAVHSIMGSGRCSGLSGSREAMQRARDALDALLAAA